MVGCACSVCTSANPKNQRTRCSVLIETPRGNILIDTTPELRLQLLREKVRLVHAVLYTHYHADHVYGLDDLRPIPKYLQRPVPVYCTQDVERRIKQAFAYAFADDGVMRSKMYLPNLTVRRITEEPFEVLGEKITPIPLIHGHVDVFGFRIGDVAYCTDVNAIPNESWPLLQDLRVLVIDALRYRKHPAHFSLEEALDVIQRVRPERAYLTHIAHEMDHETLERQLPPNVAPAFDGLRFSF